MRTGIRQYDLKQLVHFIESKHVAVPEFQRGFVWKTKQVKDLFDSLVNQYPVGSFILWKTNKFIEARSLDGERLPKSKFLILDGQQRLASIFYLCRQNVFAKPSVKPKFQESCGSRERDVIDFDKFSIGRDENGPILEYGHDSSERIEFLRFYKLLKKGTYKFPVVVISLNDYRRAIQVFERINQAGTRISTESIFLSEAWSRRSRINKILKTWKRGHKNALTRGIDTVIFIHAFAIIVQLKWKYKGAVEIRVRKLKDIAERMVGEENQDAYNRTFKDVVSSIADAVSYLKQHYGINKLEALPSQTMITVLSVFFYFQRRAPNKIQLKELRKWFWRSSLRNRYIGSGYSENIDRDVRQMRALAERNSRLDIKPDKGQLFAKLREIDLRTGRSTYRNIVRQALWQQQPIFINGVPVNRAEVETEKHKPDDDHFFPYDWFKKGLIGPRINNILNLHFLGRNENISKSNELPSKWLQNKIETIGPSPGDIKRYFKSQLLPFKTLRDVKRYEKAFLLKGKVKRRRKLKRDYERFLKKRFRLFEQTLTRLQNGTRR